jgi:hypothetical protein
MVINNIPPHEGFWMGLLKLAIPTIAAAALASGITLYGVNKTHKHQATENEASRKHLLQVEIAKAEIAAKYKSRDRRWEFRKELHVDLNKTTVDVMLTLTRLFQFASLRNHDSEVVRENAWKNIRMLQDELTLNVKAFWHSVTLAPLATAEGVFTIVEQNYRQMGDRIDWDADPEKDIESQLDATTRCLKALQTAGRKDLWETSEPEAKAEPAKQTQLLAHHPAHNHRRPIHNRHQRTRNEAD